MFKANSVITAENAKFLCRTCLTDIEGAAVHPAHSHKTSGSASEEGVKLVTQKCLPISANKKLQKLIEINIDCGKKYPHYPRNVCMDCYIKFENFEIFLKQAERSLEVLQSAFDGADKPEEESGLGNNFDSHDALFEPATVNVPKTLPKDDIIESSDPFLEEPLHDEITSLPFETDNHAKDETETAVKDTLNVPTTETNIKKNTQESLKGKTIKKELSYCCEICEKRFMRKYHYDAHLLKHEGSTKPYACDQCSKTYSVISALRYHKYVAHKLTIRAFKCEVCSREYKTEASLKNHHQEQHLGQKRPKRIICEQCGARFISAKSLLIHNKAKHAITEYGTEYKCSSCDTPFRSPYSLRYHMMRHHLGEKNCTCSICGTGFAKKFMLMAHMRTHTSEAEKFPCGQCCKRFVTKADVDRHVRMVHLKIKPHVCSYCSESFGTSKTLRHHIYIHTGEKPYVCDICGHAFRQLTAMKTHRNRHSEDVSATKRRKPKD